MHTGYIVRKEDWQCIMGQFESDLKAGDLSFHYIMECNDQAIIHLLLDLNDRIIQLEDKVKDLTDSKGKENEDV